MTQLPKMSRAVILGRINRLYEHVARARTNYGHTTHAEGVTAKQKAQAAQEFSRTISEHEEALYNLKNEMEAGLKDENSIEMQYGAEFVRRSLQLARQDVLKRFAHFPFASALLDMFIMYLEIRLEFNSMSIMLRDTAAVEDRVKSGNGFYDILGEPKTKG